MFPSNQLTHEQNMALNVFEGALPHFNTADVFRIGSATLSILQEGNTFFSEGHLCTGHIPRTSNWKWNQSRAKVNVDSFNRQYHLTFFKLNTRKNPEESIPAPLYKVWIFNLTNRANGEKISFFWCEKGIPHGTLDNTLLEKLSFLSEFMSNECAAELGWIKQSSQSFDSPHP